MADIIQEKLYTADDLWELSADDRNFELDNGRLVDMSPTGDVHGIVAGWLLHLIIAHVVANDLGDVTAAETGYRLWNDPDTVRAPDIGFISKARLTALTGKYIPVPPDLAVEIVSPNDTAPYVRHKVTEYLKANVRLIWIIYPEDKLIDVFRPNQNPVSLKIEDTLDGYDVLPGLRLAVRDVFARMRV